MKKQSGYVIARTGTATTYFTSSSAFDKPTWVPLSEASVYATPEIAHRAASKLWGYGSYSADIKSLTELFDEERPEDMLPKDELEAELGEPALDAPVDDTGYGADGETEGGDIDPIDGAVDGEVCPECECDPCECEGEPSAYGDDADVSAYGGDEGGDIDPIDGAGGEGDVDMTFELPDDPKKPTMESVLLELSKETLSSYIQKGLQSVEDDIKDHKMVKATSRAKKLTWAAQKIKEKKIKESAEIVKPVPIKDPAVVADVSKVAPVAGAHDSSVSIPSDLLSKLKTVVDAFKKEAEEKNEHDDTRASFCLTAANALQQLYDDLSSGTVDGLKQAQIHMTSYMNPISSHIPAEVVTFITRGGTKNSLKDLFAGIKESKRTDYDTMASQYKK